MSSVGFAVKRRVSAPVGGLFGGKDKIEEYMILLQTQNPTSDQSQRQIDLFTVDNSDESTVLLSGATSAYGLKNDENSSTTVSISASQLLSRFRERTLNFNSAGSSEGSSTNIPGVATEEFEDVEAIDGNNNLTNRTLDRV